MTSFYSAAVQQHMCRFASFLSEKGRRRYAAVEAKNLGHRVLAYIAGLFKLSPTIIGAGSDELEEQEDHAADRVWEKGALDAR